MLPAIGFVAFLAAVAYGDVPVWSPDGCGNSKYSDAGEMPLPPGSMRIVGGMEARPNEFPWQVSVRRKQTNGHFCGGFIINSWWIVTAAHCMDGEQTTRVSLVVGDHQRSATDANAPSRQTLDVAQIIMHAGYNSNTMENDISLVRTATQIQLNTDVFPVCAPDSNDLYTHRKSECSGWGTLSSGGTCCPDTLQYVTMNITTNAYCDAAYPQYPVFDDMICATDNTGSTSRDSCQGDSGGPLSVKAADGKFHVVGIVSWGIGCASGYPGVYARVSTFNDWIGANIGA